MTRAKPEDYDSFREAEREASMIVGNVDEDRILWDMQGGTAAAALREAFAATPAQMGEAARAAAQRGAGEQILRDRAPANVVELRRRVEQVANRLCAVVERWELFQRWPNLIHIGCGDRWAMLVDEPCAEMVAHGWDRWVTQLKEKLGDLRVRIKDGAPALRTAIAIAWRRSLHICEECGRSERSRGGNLDPGGPARVWTFCDACAHDWAYPA